MVLSCLRLPGNLRFAPVSTHQQSQPPFSTSLRNLCQIAWWVKYVCEKRESTRTAPCILNVEQHADRVFGNWNVRRCWYLISQRITLEIYGCLAKAKILCSSLYGLVYASSSSSSSCLEELPMMDKLTNTAVTNFQKGKELWHDFVKSSWPWTHSFVIGNIDYVCILWTQWMIFLHFRLRMVFRHLSSVCWSSSSRWQGP